MARESGLITAAKERVRSVLAIPQLRAEVKVLEARYFKLKALTKASP